MAQIYVSIGSNIHRHRYITAALDALADRFGELQISPIYESEAVGFDGENFYNLVAGFSTGLSVASLVSVCRAIEDANGRLRTGPKFSARTLDIDILTVDDAVGEVDGVVLPRAEILSNAFVLQPLFDIAPEVAHPADGRSYRQLWQAYNSEQKLWAIDFEWRGQLISKAA
ncbi:2-amino-4-hydroxy-6-hydroxymethyldihydropteridine diphosphokinase [Sinobacterium caligoides]|uniref:2-amino-4-hydroxy-6-hydroxymethyldihydropteridine diphosphokinase n=1 Tax=Sinobacterium caligoides TaxID=933926 RepID=A0A3N2DPG3_9GAMM|nr:2-amino-4-hydroxy-6-hydroxymethyldihydropteridine diphosphokinase [Sinobacterium caligoides]ROS01670.1 2-amino-4-hydroxy-6-hydroxymethyldihydropteridine diphosphokinase [Sinobacterium caligoides]